MALVLLDDALDIRQSQSVPFYVVYISRLFPVKFVKYLSLYVFCHSYALVRNLKDHLIPHILRSYIYLGRLVRILYRVVQDVHDHIGHVEPAGQDLGLCRLEALSDIALPILDDQLKMGNCVLNDVVKVNHILTEVELILFQFRDTEHIFHLGMHPFIPGPKEALEISLNAVPFGANTTVPGPETLLHV